MRSTARKTKKISPLLICLLPALVLLGCGGGGSTGGEDDAGKIEAAIHTLILGEGPSGCAVATQSFLEQHPSHGPGRA
jgi:hypothetical protein